MERQKYRQEIVALLPMKAHSERVKNKNFRLFNGKPLFRWTLDSLLSVKQISKVIINTDARQILAENGLTQTERIIIRDRKPEICGDFVSMNLIIKDDIENVPGDIYLMTHTTNPLLSAGTIKQALKAFNRESSANNIDSLFTVNRFQSRFYDKNGMPVNHNPDKLIRTQDLDPMYEENSNLYIFTKNSYDAANARIGKKPLMFETPYLESIDIDDQKSWDLAEAVGK